MAKIAFTAGRVSGFKCPPDKKQAFMWDVTAPGLGLRATPAGKPAYVFQSVYQGKDLRITIGSPAAWSIPDAQAKARELQRLIDEGKDPRDLKREALAAHAEKQAAAAADAVTVGEAWQRYLEQRRPFWGELNYRDHVKMAQAGGEQRKRLPDVKTIPGPLAELMPLRLAELTAPVIEAWAAREAKDRPARVRLALRLLKAFMRWAASEPDLKGKADPAAASAKKAREVAGKAKPKNDYIQREQLPVWFEYVRQIQNPVIAAYLQCLLLTGARREELAELKWEDVNFQWRGMELKDKIEGRRAVPLTPYVSHLLAALPRRNEWVFSSPGSASGRLTEPSIAHRQACAAAGLELTLHGLRRSFASLCEWLDIPGGISAQIQGHAPQGVREQNYIRRPLDLLRVHHERIEAWILEHAGIVFDAKAAPGALRVVNGGAV
ncbi:integrase family protein [Alicycliphilus sp. B1]|nr:integrase family protein [Alicycliphilus sp. B1]